MALTISNNGINLIKKFEGCRLSAYRDAVGVITIGYGWTKAIDGKPLTMSTKITQAKAESLLKEGLKSYESKVNKYDSKYHWNQNQFDALVSFCYNIGNVDGLTANGTRSISEIANKFISYNKAGGVVLSGLTKRRNEEKSLFLKATSTSSTSSISNNNTNTSSANASYTHKDFVKDVQSVIGAKVDGVAGSETLSKVKNLSCTSNSTHISVKYLQKYLNAIGYDCGTADSIFGQKTKQAVIRYQKTNKLSADGIVGKNTWKMLLS